MWWCFYFVAILSGFFAVVTIVAEIYLRTRPMYQVAKRIKGPKLRSFWDDLQFTLSLNLENTFVHLRSFANTYKQTYRYFSFGIFHVHVIRAEEAEVVLFIRRSWIKLLIVTVVDHFIVHETHGQEHLLSLLRTLHGTRTFD